MLVSPRAWAVGLVTTRTSESTAPDCRNPVLLGSGAPLLAPHCEHLVGEHTAAPSPSTTTPRPNGEDSAASSAVRIGHPADAATPSAQHAVRILRSQPAPGGVHGQPPLPPGPALADPPSCPVHALADGQRRRKVSAR